MREMKKGSLGLLILHLLHERPSYGYELTERLRERSQGELTFEDAAVYPLLHAYERDQLVEGVWEQDDTSAEARKGARRRYYHLTPRGVEALRAALWTGPRFRAPLAVYSEPKNERGGRRMTSRKRTSSATIDAYLTALAARLTVAPAERATIIEEIRGHLEEASAAEVARGSTEAEGEARAVAAFGSVATTAHSINVALPVYWDLRRMAWGILLGVLAIWIVWTLATFPFLVQMVTDHQLNTIDGSPGNLLFTASPLAFGLFYVLRDGPWAALLILALFGAIAFVLGSRASSGRRAGLAFGLGVVVGLPFLLPAIVYTNSFIRPLAMLLFIVPIWLLVPYAIFAAWLGARTTHMRDAHALGRPPSTIRAVHGVATAAHGMRRLSASMLVGLVLLVALLGANGWSLVRAANIAPPVAVPVSQQIRHRTTESALHHPPARLPA